MALNATTYISQRSSNRTLQILVLSDDCDAKPSIYTGELLVASYMKNSLEISGDNFIQMM